jgi:hypothetical protein
MSTAWRSSSGAHISGSYQAIAAEYAIIESETPTLD